MRALTGNRTAFLDSRVKFHLPLLHRHRPHDGGLIDMLDAVYICARSRMSCAAETGQRRAKLAKRPREKDKSTTTRVRSGPCGVGTAILSLITFDACRRVGATVTTKFVLALPVEVTLIIVGQFVNGEIRKPKLPTALRTCPALKGLSISPHQFTVHR
jgi:hypothetical protein